MTVLATKKGARISLVKVFSGGLVGILCIFILLSYFTFTRLLSFESTLTHISDKSLPNLILISQLYSQAATLLESTAILSKSSSNASNRLAEKQLQTNLINVRQAAEKIFKNEFLDTQLDTIAMELDELSALIENRLQTLNNIEFLRTQMYELNTHALDLENQLSPAWALGVSQVLVNVSRALNEKKLQRVRFLFILLKKQLNELSVLFAKGQNNAEKRQLTNQFKTLLFSENGMEASKIQYLRLNGRAIGRENFVHNLILDYVAQLGFVTNETEQNITLQVASSVIKMKQQTQLIRSILIGGVIVLLFIVVLFQQRVLKRIRLFNHIVRRETQGFENQTVLDGNDEITDLAEAFNEFTQTIEIQKQKLEQLSMSDGLTGIANRRALDIRLKHDIKLSVRQKSGVALLLMDLDCFKLYNDNYGHIAGDQCLKDVSKLIGDSLHRDSDFVARYGGEEFVCVLPNTDAKGAQEIAIHIIEKLKNMALPHKYSNVADYVTMSIGIATSQPNSILTPEAIIRQADSALYAAKETGKNAYSLYSPAINSK
ncbi:diguanylate cyclase [Paraglaciecola sp. MB-3u-78]|uniref:diguanylate cyclase n=1 Tax=Paraglaciecola sp. MB-3u-78 TaxID=2058332 RepID=UPI000C32D690|nr:diguanylate cyclase [Paraglaciecola sp. MB-3u-78]PKG93191.1 GGDEF domain-containing protein [Paraglaciecola sp. MB-3u-78]